jgi:hypothetical protein
MVHASAIFCVVAVLCLAVTRQRDDIIFDFNDANVRVPTPALSPTPTPAGDPMYPSSWHLHKTTQITEGDNSLVYQFSFNSKNILGGLNLENVWLRGYSGKGMFHSEVFETF